MDAIHMIWLGPKIPTEVKHNYALWKNKYGHRLRIWRDEDCAEFGKGVWNDETLTPAQRADILRLLIVQRYGGWYVDSDCSPGVSYFPDPQDRLVLTPEDSRSYLNGFFYAPVAHEFFPIWLAEVLHGLERNCSHIATQTGPGALNRALNAYSYQRGFAAATQNISRFVAKDFRHYPAHLFSHDASVRQGKLATHLALASWMQQRQTLSLKARTAGLSWRLRHSFLGNAGDIAWWLSRERKQMGKNILSRPLRYSLLNAPLILPFFGVRLDETFAALHTGATPDEVQDLVRNLRICTLRIEEEHIISTLIRAGWKSLGGDIFGRPNFVRQLPVYHY